MPVWLSSLIVQLFQSLGAYLVTQALARAKANETAAATDAEVDQRLTALKDAYKGAINGQPITPDDKKKLRTAISLFVSGNDSRGL